MIERGGRVVIRMLENVQQTTIKPVITRVVKQESQLYTDEYAIYDRLESWGYAHKRVNHSAKEYNMLAMKMVTAFMRFTSIPLRASGHSLGRGCVHTEVSPRKSYRFTSVSSSSFTTLGLELRLCYLPCLKFY